MSSLFGSKKTPQVQFTPPGFNAGGLSASFGGNTYSVTPTEPRTSAIGGITGSQNELSDVLGGLRDTVGPGFNDLLRTRLTQVDNSARAALGDLQQNLQARRILGSSFGQDTLTRARSEFSNQRDAIVADNFLKSLAVNQQLATQQYAAKTNAFQSALNELNLEANLASDLTSRASSELANNARVNAQLEAKSQEGAGNLFGTLLGKALPLIAAPFTGGASLAALPASFAFDGAPVASSLVSILD